MDNRTRVPARSTGVKYFTALLARILWNDRLEISSRKAYQAGRSVF